MNLPGLLHDPPLTPGGDDARDELRGELADPRYYSEDLIERIVDWIVRRLDGTFESAARAGDASTLVTILVAVALLAGLTLLLSRARRTPRLPDEERPALTDEAITAAELRARASAALADGRYDDAVVDGFRALAVEAIERDRIEDIPQATAHELARALADVAAADQATIMTTADLFDAVLYGDHAATAPQAESVLELDRHLRAVRR